VQVPNQEVLIARLCGSEQVIKLLPTQVAILILIGDVIGKILYLLYSHVKILLCLEQINDQVPRTHSRRVRIRSARCCGQSE